METYNPRKSAPAKTNKFFINYSKGGYCTAISIDSATGFCLPNCVGYAQGRLLEMQGIKKVDWNIPACNAEDWFLEAQKNGLKVGQTPKLGAIICWASGKTKTSSDGCGHVAVVDAIASDGTITISESAYNSYMFKTETVKPPYARTGKTFLGFIYPTKDFGTGDYGKKATTTTKKTLTATSYPNYTDGSVYRVRKSFKDEKNSGGSFSVWKNAFSRWSCLKSSGYHIYDKGGNQLD